jgi:tetratricopeptide (TPR) repeat protein
MSKSIRTILAGIVALSLAVSVGCAGAQSAGKSDASLEKVSEVSLDPTIVSGSSDGEGGGVVHTEDAFEDAYEAFDEERYADAIEEYRRIVDHAPDSRFYRSSLYNMGLAAERIERWETARGAYRRLVEEFPDKEETNDAFFRLAGVLRQMGEPAEAAALLGQVLLRSGLEPYDRAEANVRRGELLRRLGDLKDAEHAFGNAMSIYRKAKGQPGLEPTSRLVGRARMGMGRVFHRQMADLQLELPVESMRQRLEAKARLVMRAKAAYLDAIRIHDPEVSPAAGYRLGKLFEDFYRGVERAEIPDHLTADQVDLYFETLRERIRPVLERAIHVYERNLDLSERLDAGGETAEWHRKTRDRLKRVRSLLD